MFKLGIAAIVTWIAIIIAAGVGWIINIVKLAGMPSDATGEMVLRVVGIFLPPLGVVMGYFV